MYDFWDWVFIIFDSVLILSLIATVFILALRNQDAISYLSETREEIDTTLPLDKHVKR